MTSRELALAVARDVFGGAPGAKLRGAHESFDYRASRSGLDARDRAFAAELAYGAIRARRYLDWLLQPYVGARRKDLPPAIAEILRLGAYQLARMSVEPHAAVAESVGLAKRYGHRGTAGLVNAVLRRVAERAPGDRLPKREEFASDEDFLGTLHSFPSWIVALVRRVFGDVLLDESLLGMNAPPRAAVRVNLLRASREEVQALLGDAGVRTTPSPLVSEILLVDEAPASAHLGDPELRWEQHAEIAAVPVDLLDPKAGESGVELCGGRGNKTLQIVARMQGRGFLESYDDDERKVAALRARLERFGAGGVAVHAGDARRLARRDAGFVLLDAPCSALGILGRQPEARWRKDPGDPARLSALQAQMLDAAANAVAQGGRLVYSVCSFAPEETRELVARFLREHHEFARGAVPQRYAPWLTPEGELRWTPGIQRRDGFFVVLLERRAA